MTKNPMKWWNPRFANPETKQPLLTRRLSQPPDAFKQRAPRGFFYHPHISFAKHHHICQDFQTTFKQRAPRGFFTILTFHLPKMLSNNELLEVFLPSSHLPGLSFPQPGSDNRLPPTTGVGPCQSKPSNKNFKFSKSLLFWSNIDLSKKLRDIFIN